MAENPTPQTRLRDTLLKALDERARTIDLLEAYYDGNHPLPEPPDRMTKYRQARDAFVNLSRMGVTNYVRLVADAPAERLRVTGFRFGDPKNLRNDDDAWAIWQRNHLDADSTTLHHKAFVTGQAGMLVWPDRGEAQITVEHPRHVIVAYTAGSYRQRAAALKQWIDDDGTKRVVLYLPDAVYKYRGVSDQATLDAGIPEEFEQWQPGTDDTWPIKNPLGVVPIVEFRANPDLRPSTYGGGTSEFAGVLSIQDRINKTVFDRLVTAEFQAFRQRWAVGWTPDNPNEGMTASMAHMMTFPANEADEQPVQVGEFSQADVTGFLKGVEADVGAMAAITRTPTFYTLGASISNISGDTLKALQAGHIAKCESHRDNFTESHEEVLRLALRAENNPRADDQSSMLVWRDIEHRTWAETADAVVKMQALGVPKEALWAMLPNVTPQDIERWKVLAADEALFAPEQTVTPNQARQIPAFAASTNGGP